MTSSYMETAMNFTSPEYMRPQGAYSYPDHGHTYVKSRTEDLSFVSPVSHNNRSYYEDTVPESAHERSSPEIPSIERGNKLLSFQPSTCNHSLFDYHIRQTSASLNAQLHGMFFLAESARTGTGELASSPPELTCYRRNLFQITGSVTLPRMLTYIINEQGERVAIVSQELTVSATESVEGGAVKIISVPWKTPANGQPPAPEEKVEREPSAIPLDQPANSDVDSEYSVFPIAWKRLQFRVATANNGRRRELQQHFTIRLSVVAKLANGSRVPLCDALSGHIVVRGRSPRNFQQRKDVPLSGSGASMRKSISSISSMTPTIRRTSTIESIHHTLPKIEHTADGMYSMSPTSNIRKASTTGYDWQPVHSVTAPVSPYMHPSPDVNMGAPSLKRKSTEPAPSLQLAVPQNGVYAQRNSAPPPERPRKMSRSDLGPLSTIQPSTYASQPPVSLPPATTYSYSPPSASSSHQYPTSLPKSTEPAAPVMPDYFPVHMDPWIHSADHVYRPHVPLHPTTTVGGPAPGSRGYYGSDGIA